MTNIIIDPYQFAVPEELDELTFVDSATVSSGANVTAPAGIQAGDLLIFWDLAESTNNVAPTTVLPSNFIQITNLNALQGGDDALRYIISYKIAVGSEASSTLTGMNGSQANRKGVAVFRGNVGISAVNVSTPATESTSGDPSAQNVVASGGTPPLIVFGGLACGISGAGPISAADRTFSPAPDATLDAGGTEENLLLYKIYNSSPSDTTVDMIDEGTRNFLVSFFISAS